MVSIDSLCNFVACSPFYHISANGCNTSLDCISSLSPLLSLYGSGEAEVRCDRRLPDRLQEQQHPLPAEDHPYRRVVAGGSPEDHLTAADVRWILARPALNEAAFNLPVPADRSRCGEGGKSLVPPRLSGLRRRHSAGLVWLVADVSDCRLCARGRWSVPHYRCSWQVYCSSPRRLARKSNCFEFSRGPVGVPTDRSSSFWE